MFTNNINPILFEAGPLSIRWYGVFLALGVLTAVLVLQHLFTRSGKSKELAFDLAIWLIVGGLVGARLGHALFYNASYFFHHPLEIIFINHGGLASHGMIIGIILTLLLFAKIKKINIAEIIDPLAVVLPILALFIRLGNFFNSEIIGTPTDVPWGVWFTRIDVATLYRHPVQIYEAMLGIVVFGIAYTIYKKSHFQLPTSRIPQFFKQPHAVTALTIFLYFTGRFIAEFFKARFVFEHGLSMGQWLSLPFIVTSLIWFGYTYHGTRNT